MIELSDNEEKPANNGKAVKGSKVDKSSAGPVAHRPAANHIHTDSMRSRACTDSQDLLANISQVLDPNLRRARADDQSVNALQTGQIFTLSSQLREAQRQTEALRNQLSEAERRCQNAERHADHAELMGMITGSQKCENFPHRPPSSTPLPRQPSSRCRFCQEIYYADGSHSTRYLASDDDDAEVQGINDSPGTRCFTFEENDLAESSDHSSKHSRSSLPTSSSQDDLTTGIMEIVPPTGIAIATTGSPHRYPSLEV